MASHRARSFRRGVAVQYSLPSTYSWPRSVPTPYRPVPARYSDHPLCKNIQDHRELFRERDRGYYRYRRSGCPVYDRGRRYHAGEICSLEGSSEKAELWFFAASVVFAVLEIS